MKRIATSIRKGLRKNRLTNKEFAQIMGVTPSLVSQWINEVSIPPGDKLLRIIDELDIVEEIFPGHVRIKKEEQEMASKDGVTL